MSANLPFDLGSLADVDSPEVVKQALRTFRRRTLRTAIWVVAVVAVVAVPLVQQALSKDITERITKADGFDPGTVYTSRGVTLVLERVADLGKRTGLHLIVTAAGVAGDNDLHVQLPAVSFGETKESGYQRVVDGWYSVTVPSDGRIALSVFVSPHCESTGPATPIGGGMSIRTCTSFQTFDPNEVRGHDFTIDLKAAGVPERLWHKEGVR